MSEFNRIANIPKEKLLDFYMSMNPDELNSIVARSSGQEINRLLSHLNEQHLRNIFNLSTKEALEAIFNRIPDHRINKYLLLASEDNIKSIFNRISDEARLRILNSVSHSLRTKLLNTLPVKIKSQWKDIVDEKNNLDREFNLITSKKIGNSIEMDALDRIREIEEQANFRQEQYDARIKQSEQKLEQIQQLIVESEKRLHEQQYRAKQEEEKLKKREGELSSKLQQLREEHEKQIQNRIDIKVPEYVANAISALEKKENEYKTEAQQWSDSGILALKLSVFSAIIALAYGANEFSNTQKEEISWLFFGYLILKGLIVIGLFAAWAKHAFNQANAYMHEALKRTERTHAISFGKLYLEIYGNDVSKQDMKSIFENWNMDSQSAFKDIKQEDFQPKTLNKLKEIIELVKTNSTDSKNSNEPK